MTIQVREKTKEGGMPGLVPPPLPNQIDILLGKKNYRYIHIKMIIQYFFQKFDIIGCFLVIL